MITHPSCLILESEKNPKLVDALNNALIQCNNYLFRDEKAQGIYIFYAANNRKNLKLQYHPISEIIAIEMNMIDLSKNLKNTYEMIKIIPKPDNLTDFLETTHCILNPEQALRKYAIDVQEGEFFIDLRQQLFLEQTKDKPSDTITIQKNIHISKLKTYLCDIINSF